MAEAGEEASIKWGGARDDEDMEMEIWGTKRLKRWGMFWGVFLVSGGMFCPIQRLCTGSLVAL